MKNCRSFNRTFRNSLPVGVLRIKWKWTRFSRKVTYRWKRTQTNWHIESRALSSQNSWSLSLIWQLISKMLLARRRLKKTLLDTQIKRTNIACLNRQSYHHYTFRTLTSLTQHQQLTHAETIHSHSLVEVFSLITSSRSRVKDCVTMWTAAFCLGYKASTRTKIKMYGAMIPTDFTNIFQQKVWQWFHLWK